MRHREGESDKNLALRRMLRIENGRVSRNPATNSIDSSSARAQRSRKPSMPKMPWDDEASATRKHFRRASV